MGICSLSTTSVVSQDQTTTITSCDCTSQYNTPVNLVTGYGGSMVCPNQHGHVTDPAILSYNPPSQCPTVLESVARYDSCNLVLAHGNAFLEEHWPDYCWCNAPGDTAMINSLTAANYCGVSTTSNQRHAMIMLTVNLSRLLYATTPHRSHRRNGRPHLPWLQRPMSQLQPPRY
jgi:hypothetical protein